MKKNNPIIQGLGICDPHIHVFDNKAYLYASHDRSINNTTWLMDDWQIWSSKDLVIWEYETTFRPEETYIGKCDKCWAVDTAQRNGKYYYYFSNGNKDIGVAVADKPGGPFYDILGKPLLGENYTSTLQYDPTVFVDPDTDIPYLIWGCCEGEGYFISRLNQDMISLAEKPRQIMIDETYARDDKSFIHKKNGIYYLSWGSFYATSENIYGPYAYQGSLGISEDHGSFFSWNGQDFYAYTIFDPNNYYRATGICYIHYRANGEMVADQIIAEYGVGHYDSEWNKIQAEWYMQAKAVKKKENIWGGFDIGNINAGSELYYPNICGMKNKTKIHFLTASMQEDSWIEIWDNLEERRIGLCKVGYTGRYDHCGYRVCSCKLDREVFADKLNMKLLFKGKGDEIMRIHWFKFT